MSFLSNHNLGEIPCGQDFNFIQLTQIEYNGLKKKTPAIIFK